MNKPYVNEVLKCKTCHGKGWVDTYRHGDEIPVRRTCPDCKGRGTSVEIISPRDREFIHN